MTKDFNLSKEIWDRTIVGYQVLPIEKVKEFIKEDEDLINQFACGNITLLELKKKREEIVGADLKWKEY